MKSLKVIMALGAFFVLGLGIAACGSSVPGNAVATVGGNPITLQAYKHWMYVAAKGQAAQSPGSPVIVPTDPPNFTGCIKQVRKQIPSLAKTTDKALKGDCGQLFTSLNSTVMDFLIKAYWYQAEAHRLHVKLTQKQINQSFQQAKSQSFKTTAAFQAFLSQTGQTMQDILYRVKVNTLLTKLESRHATPVNATTIGQYYKNHASQFGTPETRDLRVVRTKTASAANAARAALQRGASWATVAKQYSIDTATKNTGGYLKGVTKGEEEAALNTPAFSASVNKLEGPIHGTFGYYVFEVAVIHPAKMQTLAQATPLIRQLLTNQNQQTEMTAVNNAAKKHWGAQTLCRSTYSMNDCHGYKAPKATTPTATPTTTAPAQTVTGTTSTPSSSKSKKK
jgi:parvulin-like peptidyl-prolyl isomerase